jgi:hypothetical protein
MPNETHQKASIRRRRKGRHRAVDDASSLRNDAARVAIAWRRRGNSPMMLAAKDCRQPVDTPVIVPDSSDFTDRGVKRLTDLSWR